jgi:hypothetical protein
MCLAACTQQRGVAEGLTAPKKHPYGSLSILIKYSCILASRLKWFAFPFVGFAVV